MRPQVQVLLAPPARKAPGGSPPGAFVIHGCLIKTLRRIIPSWEDLSTAVLKDDNALLDSGTVEEMRAWLETGFRLAQADDNTPEALRHFLEVGQYEVGQ